MSPNKNFISALQVTSPDSVSGNHCANEIGPLGLPAANTKLYHMWLQMLTIHTGTAVAKSRAAMTVKQGQNKGLSLSNPRHASTRPPAPIQ